MSEPGYSACIVIACCILHNIAIRNGIELDLDEEEEIPERAVPQKLDVEEDHPDHVDEGARNRHYIEGMRIRDEIVADYLHLING